MTSQESNEIDRLSRSRSVLNVSDAILEALNEETLSKTIAGYLYFRSKGKTSTQLGFYLGTDEVLGLIAFGLKIMGALLPALILDKKFRALAARAGIRVVGEQSTPFSDLEARNVPVKESNAT